MLLSMYNFFTLKHVLKEIWHFDYTASSLDQVVILLATRAALESVWGSYEAAGISDHGSLVSLHSHM